jgi:hypothetical protein
MSNTKPTAAQIKLMTAAAARSGISPKWTKYVATESACISRGWMAYMPNRSTVILTPAGYALVA